MAELTFRSAFDSMDGLSPIFVTSFCRHIDEMLQQEGLLSQWRSYGSDGGYCIVFDQDKFIDLVNSIQNPKKFAGITQGEVRYPRQISTKELDGFDGVATELFKIEFNRLCELNEMMLPNCALKPFVDVLGSSKLDKMLIHILSKLPFLKHPAFEAEQEFRIAAPAFSNAVESPHGKPDPFEFRQRGNELVPFVKLFDEKNILPIKRILVGPGNNFERRVHGVGQLVRSLSLKIDVVSSTIPYL